MHGRGAHVRLALGALWLALALLALAVLAGAAAALLLAPAALLLALLFLGRYPGERAVCRLAAGVVVPRAVRRISPPRPPRLLGSRLAGLSVPGCGRAPPVATLS